MFSERPYPPWPYAPQSFIDRGEAEILTTCKDLFLSIN